MASSHMCGSGGGVPGYRARGSKAREGANVSSNGQEKTHANGESTNLPAGIGNLATSLADYPPKVSIVNSRSWASMMR